MSQSDSAKARSSSTIKTIRTALSCTVIPSGGRRRGHCRADRVQQRIRIERLEQHTAGFGAQLGILIGIEATAGYQNGGHLASGSDKACIEFGPRQHRQMQVEQQAIDPLV